jgi:hypothetical protein
VKFRPLISLRFSSRIFRLARAELSEVFGGAGDDVGEEFHFDAAQGFAAEGDVEEDDGVGGGGGRLVCHLLWCVVW